MERLVFAVIDGRFSERITLTPGYAEASGKAMMEHRIEVVCQAIQCGLPHEPSAQSRQHLERKRGYIPSTRQLAKQGVETAGWIALHAQLR
jgi:hypothetical protein